MAAAQTHFGASGAWPQDDNGRVHTPLEPVVLVATLFLIPVFILEFDASGGWKQAALVANWLIWGVFAAELAAILIVAKRKTAALRAHWLDMAVVIFAIPLFSQLLASLRFARFARLLRFLRATTIVARAIQAQRRLTSAQTLRAVALFTAFAVVIAGIAEAEVDSGADSGVNGYWDGIWWAVETVTTVGYGDEHPASVAGRIVAILLMIVGIGFLSVLTASIASHFVQSDTSSDGVLDALQRIEKDIAELKAASPRVEVGVTARRAPTFPPIPADAPSARGSKVAVPDPMISA
jgi:voltage-gated potassium channel